MAVLPEAGWIGVTPSKGFIPLMIRLVTRSPHAAHAFIATGVDDEIIEAEPDGARRGHASEYADVIWLENLAAPLSVAQRAGAVAWAVAHLGTPYSWVDDAEIGFVSLFHWAPRWMRRRLASIAQLMCSQLCAAAYLYGADDDLFGAALPPGGVSPGALLRLDRARGKAAS